MKSKQSKQSQFEYSKIHDIRDDAKFKMENNLTCILCNISHVVYITRKYLLHRSVFDNFYLKGSDDPRKSAGFYFNRKS